MNKTIEQFTLYDLCADDFHVWLSENKKFGYNLEIDNGEGTKVVEEGLHKCAADALADFCSRYLRTYERAIKEKELVA